MNNQSYIIAIIPARGGSKRLPKKNIYPIWGKPMIEWSIIAAQNSKHINKVFVSTENKEIMNIAKNKKCDIIVRPDNLAQDSIIKMDVIKHGVEYIEKNKKPEIIVSLQANSPQVTDIDIDRCIDKLLDDNLWEVFSVDKNLNQNGAIRVMRYDTIFLNTLSVHVGCVVTDIFDVHYYKDVDMLEKYK
jgi:CMP-N,N'-diacetyllegionaminic acid synthase